MLNILEVMRKEEQRQLEADRIIGKKVIPNISLPPKGPLVYPKETSSKISVWGQDDYGDCVPVELECKKLAVSINVPNEWLSDVIIPSFSPTLFDSLDKSILYNPCVELTNEYEYNIDTPTYIKAT